MRITAIFVLTIISMVIAVRLSAEERHMPIHGLIIDKNTYEGIGNAAVSAYNDQLEVYSVSDSSGNFILYAPEGSKCRICVYCENYGSEISDEFTVSACTPYLKIEMDKVRYSAPDSGIDYEELISLAEMTYVEHIHDSAYFASDVERIQNSTNLRKVAKGKICTILKVIWKDSPVENGSQDNRQYMMMAESITLTVKNESATESLTGRKPNGRRIRASLKAYRNNA